MWSIQKIMARQALFKPLFVKTQSTPKKQWQKSAPWPAMCEKHNLYMGASWN